MRPAVSSALRRSPNSATSRANAGMARFTQWTRSTTGAGFATFMIWLAFFIMVVPQGLDYKGINGMPTSSDALAKIVWMILLGGSAAILAQRRSRVMTMLQWTNPFLLGFIGLAAASILWSIDSAVTTRRVIRAATVVAVCLVFVVVTWEPKRFQKVLRSLLTAAMVASIVFVMVDPENAIHGANNPELKNAWHGITMGKNLLGSLASTCLVCWLHAWMAKEERPFTCVGGITVALINLIMTRSAASLLATGFAVIFFLMLLRSPNTLKRSMPYLVGLFATVVLLYSLAVLNIVRGLDALLAPITMLTGKDMTFTGRTAIWDILKESIAWHPWFGGGYGAYWVGPQPTSPSYVMLTRLYFYPTEGHNGYMDVLNDLGRVGLMCLLAYFAWYIRQSLQVYKIDRYQGALYLTLIFRGFLADMSESHWWHCMSVDYVLMTFATINLSRHVLHNELYKGAVGRVPTRGW